ncbi:Reverse transcriptase zinc-binding domain, partial [Sesbania bispinosa]
IHLSPNLGPLLNHSQGQIPSWQLDLLVAAFANNGSWNWELLYEFITPYGLAVLSSIKPPDDEAGSDSLTWLHSASGEFSIKSAYNYLMGASDHASPPNPIFKKIWAWQGPPRISSFIWKFYHGRLLTNSEIMKKGMSFSDICP